MSQSNTMSAAQQNAMLRAQFLATATPIRRTLPQMAIAAGQSLYSIPLINQGYLTSIDLEFSITVSAAAAASPQAGAPYSLVSNINFVDQSNVTRHNLGCHWLFDYLSYKAGQGWGSALSYEEGGANYAGITDPAVPAIAAGGSQAVKFWVHVPISKSRYDLTGMVPLQTGNQNQPAVINITLTPLTNGTGDSPYSTPITITGGSITAHQNYLQGAQGVVAPPMDVNTQWVLSETGADSTNWKVGGLKQILFQTQFLTSLVGVRYFNGAGFAYGTDLTSLQEKRLGGSLLVDDSSPAFRYRRYRIAHGVDGPPGTYFFDFTGAPILNAAVGQYLAEFVASTAGATAYSTTLYDWLKVPQQLGVNAGATQIG